MNGKYLKEMRNKNGYTQQEVAKLIGVNKQTIFKYESDMIINIPHEKLEKLAKLYKTTSLHLIGWGDDLIENGQFIENVCRGMNEKEKEAVFKEIEVLIKKYNRKKKEMKVNVGEREDISSRVDI